MVNVINYIILERKSCLSTFKDMYLEVVECLNRVNRSVYGFPVIVVLIAGNIGEIIKTIYRHLLFPKDVMKYRYYALLAIIELLLRTANLIILHGIGYFMVQEVFKYLNI